MRRIRVWMMILAVTICPYIALAVDGDNDGYDSAVDCDDTRNYVYPGAPEICDGLDNDCDTFVDEGVKQTYYRDADGDTYGTSSPSTQACSAPAGYVANSTDCDDMRSYVYPGAPEICDGLDNDCDTFIDEGVKQTYYLDADGDGYGAASSSTQACSAPAGYVANSTDCDDSKSHCSSDCTDVDNDTYCVTADCNDNNPVCTTDCSACITPINTETPSPTATYTNTSTATPTDTNTAVATVTDTHTSTPAPTDTDTPVATATDTDTPTTMPTGTDTPVATATDTDTPTTVPTGTDTPIPTTTDTTVVPLSPTPTVTSRAWATCAATPLIGCDTSMTSAILKFSGSATKAKVRWKAKKGTVATVGDFGNPVAGVTSYRLCVYDDGVLKMSPSIAPGPPWVASGTTRYRYRSETGNSDGITKVRLKSGIGNAVIAVKGKGASLALPGLPLTAANSVTVQFVKDSGVPICWETSFDPSMVTQDATAGRFKAQK